MQSVSFVWRLSGLYWSTKVVEARQEDSAAVVKAAEPLTTKMPHMVLERAAQVLHYSWYASLMAVYMTPAGAAVFFVISQLFAGLLLALVFGVGHNGMSVIDADKKPGFAEQQVSAAWRYPWRRLQG